ncbi:hypothetical protein [Moritella dasanensis]|uniref:hypothetical protein n=1 Tax=Moritella dasanensis TaxID=428031 RepID=UPI0002FAD6F9|nr:hypothetical protein [Moritella dasanensis]
MLNNTFNALCNEAMFTKDILGAGATQIRSGNYAQKGAYFQSFTSLSTGLERVGKICLILDYYIENDGKFPDFKYLKNQIGHDLELIYQNSQTIIRKRDIKSRWLKNLDGEVHSNIIKLLSSFAKGDRYSNINVLINSKQQNDPVAIWFEKVDLVLFKHNVTEKKKQKIANDARITEQITGHFTFVNHTSELGASITSVEDACFRTGVYESVAPLRQLFVLQIIRYWIELASKLQYLAMELGYQDIPFLNEIFAPFYNDDSYFKTRKTWDKF